MSQSVIAIIILVAVIILYATEKIPLVLTSMLSMLAMYFSGILEFGDAFGGFANNATHMVIGMSIFGVAFSSTGLADLIGEKLGEFFSKHQMSEKKFLTLGTILSAVLSTVISPVLIVAIFMNIIDGLASQKGSVITRRHTVLPLSQAATAGASSTIISSTTVILSSGLLAESAMGRGFTFFEPALIGGTFLLTHILFYATIGYPLMKKVYNFEEKPLVIHEKNEEKKERSKYKCTMTLVILAICVLFFIFSDFKLGAMAMAGGAALILTGCITADEAFNKINWPIVLLVACSIGFAKGIDVSGAGVAIAEFLIRLCGPLAQTGIGLCIIGLIASSLLSNVMSNSSTALILIPILFVMAEKIGCPYLPVALSAGVGAGLAMATPICTTNITQTTPVGYRFKDYLIVGGLLNVCSIITCTIVLYLVFFLGK